MSKTIRVIQVKTKYAHDKTDDPLARAIAPLLRSYYTEIADSNENKREIFHVLAALFQILDHTSEKVQFEKLEWSRVENCWEFLLSGYSNNGTMIYPYEYDHLDNKEDVEPLRCWFVLTVSEAIHELEIN